MDVILGLKLCFLLVISPDDIAPWERTQPIEDRNEVTCHIKLAKTYQHHVKEMITHSVTPIGVCADTIPSIAFGRAHSSTKLTSQRQHLYSI